MLRARTLVGVVLATMAFSSPALADEPTDLEEALAEPVVETASKSAEDETVAPATTTTISAEDLRRYGIHSLDEAINFLSLGMITQNPLHSVEVGSRGVLLTSDFGNHVLLLINGHAVNEQWDGTAYFERGMAVPFELIDHIEIILGPGSVLYGSNAMLGVINVVTKRAKDYEGVHLIAESELVTSERVSAGAGHEFKLFGKPAEVTFQAEYYTQNGPAFTFAPQNYGNDSVTGMPRSFGPRTQPGIWGGTVNNEYYTHIPSAYLRVMWGDFELNVRAATYQRATPYMNHFNLFASDFDDPGTYELDRWVSVDLKHRAALSSILQLRSRLYADSYDYQESLNTSSAQDCLAGMNNGCHEYLLGISRWAGLEEQLAFDWLHDSTLTTLIGADGRGRFVGAQTDYSDRLTHVDPGSIGVYQHTEYALGVYAQQTARPLSWLDLNVGARFDDDQRFGTKLSPRAAAAVKPWKGGTLRVIYSEAFRSPTAYETSYTDGVLQVPAPNLKPETVQSTEGTIEHRVGTHRVLFGAFYASWNDMVLQQTLGPNDPALVGAIKAGILPQGTTQGIQYQNVSQIQSYGFNAGIDGSLLSRDLRYGITFTGAHARRSFQTGPDLPLTVAPQFFGNARLSYDLPGDLPVLGVAGVLVSKRPADRAFDGGFTPTPYAPAQLELRGTVSGPVPYVTGLSYRFSADYAFASVNPYVAGPVQQATAMDSAAALSPIDQFRTTIGLQYDLR